MAEDKLEYMLCPKRHHVHYARWNYARDDSDGDKDADRRPMFESGLYCIGCERPYGLSKLRTPEGIDSSVEP